MADSLGDLLPKQRFEEPPEVRIIKDFVQTRYQQTVGVTMGQTQITIHVASAALAGTLRTQLHELSALCFGNQPPKRLILRIG